MLDQSLTNTYKSILSWQRLQYFSLMTSEEVTILAILIPWVEPLHNSEAELISTSDLWIFKTLSRRYPHPNPPWETTTKISSFHHKTPQMSLIAVNLHSMISDTRMTFFPLESIALEASVPSKDFLPQRGSKTYITHFSRVAFSCSEKTLR